jgi:hypothetical protein
MKIKKYKISPEFLKILFSGRKHYWRVISGQWPNDSEIITVNINNLYDEYIYIYVKSDTFPDIPIGDPFPTEEMIIENYGEPCER